MHARMCPSILEGIVSQTSQYKDSKIKHFGDRAFCPYAPRLWNELPDNIKTAVSVQNLKTPENIAISKEFI